MRDHCVFVAYNENTQMTNVAYMNIHMWLMFIGHRPGSATATGLEWTVCTKRCPVLDASPRGSAARCCRTSRQSDGRRSSGRLHGSHPYLPGAGRKAQSTPRRLSRVQLPQSHRSIHLRFVYCIHVKRIATLHGTSVSCVQHIHAIHMRAHAWTVGIFSSHR